MTDRAITLLQDVRPIVERHRWLRRRHALDFNVFSILRVDTNEVHGHSRFLAELLSPEGTHGMGCAFLKPFIRRLSETNDAPAVLAEITEFDQCRLQVEHAIADSAGLADDQGGRIDLLIQAGETWIIIENKIYAGDQYHQMRRYADYARRHGKKAILCYLTLDGSSPSEDSLGSFPPGDVIALGYGSFIDEWLSECLGIAAMLPPVRESIAQYQRLVRRLAGGGAAKELTMEIADQLMTQERMEAAIEIEGALNEARTRLQMMFWDDLRAAFDALSNMGPCDFVKGMLPSHIRVKSYYAKGKRGEKIGLSFKLASAGGKRDYVLFVTVHDVLYYGLGIAQGGDWPRNWIGNEKPVAEKILKSVDASAVRDAWSINLFPRRELPFGAVDERECLHLLDRTKRKEHVEAIVGEVANLVTKLRAAFATNVFSPIVPASSPKRRK